MSILDKLLPTSGTRGIIEASGRKASVTWLSSELRYMGPGQPVWTPRDYASFAREGYQQNPVVYACISTITDCFGGLPIKLFQVDEEGEVEEVDAHPLLDVIANPNPMQSEFEFKRAWGSYLLVSGNTYVHGPGPESGGNRGKPRELWPLEPDKMKIIAGDWLNPVRAYQYADDIARPLPRDVIMHTRLFNPLNRLYGMSPMEAAAYGIDQHNESSKWNKSMLDNLGVPPVWLHAKGTLTDKQIAQMGERWEKNVSGAENARKPMFSHGGEGMDYVKLGMTAVELDWLEGRKALALEICGAFKVPAQIIGVPDSQTYANMEQAWRGLYDLAVLPLAATYCDSLSRWLLPKYVPDARKKRMYFWFDTSGIYALQENQTELMKRAVMGFKAGVLTQRQAVRMVGGDEDLAEDLYVWELTPQPLAADEAEKEEKKALRLLTGDLHYGDGAAA